MLKYMTPEVIKNLSFVIMVMAGGISIIVSWVKRIRVKRLRFEQVEKLATEIERLYHEKRREQIKTTRERSNILFSDYLRIFCEEMKVNEDGKEAAAYEALILNCVRLKTDKMMEEVIDVNNIAGRVGDAWSNYKKSKFKYILSEVIRYIKMIWREDVVGFKHDLVVGKCRERIVETYMEQIEEMFNEIKNICINFEDRIQLHKAVLKDLKNGNKKQRK